jgi:hypothetical protein
VECGGRRYATVVGQLQRRRHLLRNATATFYPKQSIATLDPHGFDGTVPTSPYNWPAGDRWSVSGQSSCSCY